MLNRTITEKYRRSADALPIFDADQRLGPGGHGNASAKARAIRAVAVACWQKPASHDNRRVGR